MPPKRLKLSEVPKYISEKHNGKACRATVYNWTVKGVRGIKLRFVLGKSKQTGSAYASVRITTAEWVDEFLSQCPNVL